MNNRITITVGRRNTKQTNKNKQQNKHYIIRTTNTKLNNVRTMMTTTTTRTMMMMMMLMILTIPINLKLLSIAMTCFPNAFLFHSIVRILYKCEKNVYIQYSHMHIQKNGSFKPLNWIQSQSHRAKRSKKSILPSLLPSHKMLHRDFIKPKAVPRSCSGTKSQIIDWPIGITTLTRHRKPYKTKSQQL